MSFLPLILYMGGKWCITMSFSTIYIYTAELFPTNLRHSLLGICSMTGRMGSILSPQTPLLVSRLPQECTSRRPIRTACWLFAYNFKQWQRFSDISLHTIYLLCNFIYVALWNRYIDCWLIIIHSGDIIFFIFQSKCYIGYNSVYKNNCYRIVSFFFFWSIYSYFYVTGTIYARITIDTLWMYGAIRGTTLFVLPGNIGDETSGYGVGGREYR